MQWLHNWARVAPARVLSHWGVHYIENVFQSLSMMGPILRIAVSEFRCVVMRHRVGGSSLLFRVADGFSILYIFAWVVFFWRKYADIQIRVLYKDGRLVSTERVDYIPSLCWVLHNSICLAGPFDSEFSMCVRKNHLCTVCWWRTWALKSDRTQS